MMAALGRIVDVDIAEETTNLSKYSIEQQAAGIHAGPGEPEFGCGLNAPSLMEAYHQLTINQ